MVGVGAAGAGDDPTLIGEEIFVREPPAPLTVDDADAGAARARPLRWLAV